MLRKCLQMMSCQILCSMSLKVSLRGVYCFHDDAPEGAALEDKFLDIEDQNGFIWPWECIDIKDDLIQFWFGNMVEVSCYDPMHWLFGPWNGLGIVLCDFTIVCFQNQVLSIVYLS